MIAAELSLQINPIDMKTLKDNGDFWMRKLTTAVLHNFPTGEQTEQTESSKTLEMPDRLFSGLPEKIVDNSLNRLKLYLLTLNVLIFRYTSDRNILITLPPLRVNGNESEGAFFSIVEMQNNMAVKDVLKQIHQQMEEGICRQQFDVNQFSSKWGINYPEAKALPFNIGLVYEELSSQNYPAKFAVEIKIDRRCGVDWVTVTTNDIHFQNNLAAELAQHFVDLLGSIAKDLNTSIKYFQLPQGIRNSINHPVEQVRLEPAHQLFEKQVEINPSASAVIFKDQEYSYQYINCAANRLANHLINTGSQKGEPIGILMERSADLVVAVIGILKAGGVCLPIDPGFPTERKQRIIDDSGLKSLVTTADYQDELASLVPNIITIEMTQDASSVNPNINVSMADLIYIIYSSGTTGRPNGIMIEHRSFSNLLEWYNRQYDFAKNQNLVQLTRITVDIAFQEIFSALINGIKLFVPSEEVVLNRDAFRNYLQRHTINFIQLIPSTLDVYLCHGEKIQSLNCVLCGGDALPDHIKNIAIQKGYNLYNVYGQTETAIDTLVAKCSESKSYFNELVDNYEVFVLNEEGDILPAGVAGELCTTGIGLARGYLNNPELTATRFTFHILDKERKMYRTGDRVRKHSDGKIEFLGRTDTQVKVRGFRVELSDVEEALKRHPSVLQAIVLQDESVDKRLQAFIITRNGESVKELIGFSRELLPDYMVPTHFLRVDKFPLTNEGKIDRKALFSMNRFEALAENGVTFENNTQKVLWSIWKQTLNEENISLTDNFFDLGGHSLKAIDIISRIYRDLNVKISFRAMFNFPTIATLAEHIQNLNSTAFDAILPAPPQEDYVLSSAQRRLWILAQTQENQVAYNIPLAYKFDDNFNIEVLKKTFETLIERHESLRTTFLLKNGEPRQRIHNDIKLPLDYFESSSDHAECIRMCIELQLNRSFDLSVGPLFYVLVIKVERVHYVFLSLHHIIADGESIEKLEREFIVLYEAFLHGSLNPLPAFAIQYKDYAHWQFNQMKSAEYLEKLHHWKKQLSNCPAMTELPFDFDNSEIRSFKGEFESAVIDIETSSKIRSFARDCGTTLQVFLLSGFFILLSRYSLRKDILIGIPYSGRNHSDLKSLVGMFVNMLPIRVNYGFDASVRELISEVHEKVTAAIHNEWQFDQIVEELKIPRDGIRNPLFNTVFAFETHNEQPAIIPNQLTGIASLPIDSQTSHFDLELTLIERQNDFLLSLNYVPLLFKRETARKMIDQYLEIITQIVSNQSVHLNDIRIEHGFLEAEKRDLKQETVFTL